MRYCAHLHESCGADHALQLFVVGGGRVVLDQLLLDNLARLLHVSDGQRKELIEFYWA